MKIIRINGKIIEDEWRHIVNNHPMIISLYDYYNNIVGSKTDIRVYDFARFKIRDDVYGRFMWDWEHGRIEIDMNQKYLPEVYPALQQIAADLDAEFYIRKGVIFDPLKHLPVPAVRINRSQKYFENYDLELLRWVALREENPEIIMKTFGLTLHREAILPDLLTAHEEGFIITPAYAGWTFILGDDAPWLLIPRELSSSQEAVERMCKALQKLSKALVDVQYYEYSDTSNVSAYFKANNGKLNFGYWKSELEEFTKGRTPKEIKNIHPGSAHDIASVWSVDPMDFIYVESFIKINAIFAKPK